MLSQNFVVETDECISDTRLSEGQGTAALRKFRYHPLFSTLTSAQAERLVAGMRRLKLSPDQYLFHMNDYAEHIFLMESGQIKLSVNAEDGKESVLELVMPGQTIGEDVMFMPQQSYPVSAQAITESALYSIPYHMCMVLLKENAEFSGSFLRALSTLLDRRINETVSLTQERANYRLARFLTELIPARAGNGHVIYLITPKQVIASRLSIAPETLSRLMSEMAQQGIICVRGRQIRINDIERLRSCR